MNCDYYIADLTLVFYSSKYIEITPYVYGIPYFPISIYSIEDIIDENGPWAKVMLSNLNQLYAGLFLGSYFYGIILLS